MRRTAVGLCVAGVLAVAGIVTGAKVETWKHESASAFAKAKKERVVISDAGRIRLAHALKETSLGATRVWDLAKSPKGTIYAATGDEGKVYRRERDKTDWTVAYDAADSQALSVVALDDGRVFVGTGPTGKVVEISDEKRPASRPDPGVLYIWDLAADARGNLYAATGPNGQLWKRSPRGDWSLALKSKHSHLLCLAIGRDGSVYAGSDGEGLIYRLSPEGKPSVVYDAPQSEIKALAIGPDGSLYAGTAAESGGGSGSSRGGFASGGDDGPGFGGSGRGGFASTKPDVPAQAKGATPDAPKSKDTPKSTGTATPKPASAGDNSVYKIGPDGVPREIFRSRVLIHALAWQGDKLMVGTGPDGQLFEVLEDGHESAPTAKLDHGQILSLLSETPTALLIGTGDPGAVARLDAGYVPVGTLTSDVLDTKLLSRFGSLSWKAEKPNGTTVAVQVRSGNVGEPDETWSAWSPEQSDPTSARAGAPLGRFVQYRMHLRTDDPTNSPEVRSFALRYQTANLPPEITKLEVPDVASGDGATRQTKLTVRWDATDPNSDELTYSLHVRKDGWPDWLELGDKPITETRFEWDVTTLPAGSYRVKLTASDRAGNAPGDALSSDRVSEPFLIDHEAPVVTVARKSNRVTAIVTDGLTRIAKAAYAVDGGDWKPIFPEDSLFDTRKETLTIDLPELKPGTHVVLIRAFDAAGNVGTGDLVFEAR